MVPRATRRVRTRERRLEDAHRRGARVTIRDQMRLAVGHLVREMSVMTIGGWTPAAIAIAVHAISGVATGACAVPVRDAIPIARPRRTVRRCPVGRVVLLMLLVLDFVQIVNRARVATAGHSVFANRGQNHSLTQAFL